MDLSLLSDAEIRALDAQMRQSLSIPPMMVGHPENDRGSCEKKMYLLTLGEYRSFYVQCDDFRCIGHTSQHVNAYMLLRGESGAGAVFAMWKRYWGAFVGEVDTQMLDWLWNCRRAQIASFSVILRPGSCDH